MDLLKIPVEKRNFKELRNRIQNLIEEKENLPTQIQSKNDEDIQTKAEMSPLEKILNNPGLVHLAENIFGNLDDENLDVCGQINQSSNVGKRPLAATPTRHGARTPPNRVNVGPHLHGATPPSTRT